MSKNISDLRSSMFNILDELRAGKLTVEQAKAAAEIGQVVINSAKVEIEFIRETGAPGSGFIDTATAESLPNGVLSITQHKMKG